MFVLEKKNMNELKNNENNWCLLFFFCEKLLNNNYKYNKYNKQII